MGEPQDPLSAERPIDLDHDLPPGNHPLEVAARRGIGPLSPSGREVWHGNAIPCVSCGQLVRRGHTECDHCGQDLSEEMIEKMRAHTGPWYVLEHVRPFPGVSLERLVRQIRRGLLTETSIIRGPATDHQWRFVVETPGLCRYFSRCWKCHKKVSPADASCSHCRSVLTFPKGQMGFAARRAEPATPEPATKQGEGHTPRPPAAELEALSAAVDEAEFDVRCPTWEAPPRLGSVPASLIAVAMLFVVVVGLMFVSQCRSQGTRPTNGAPSMIAPNVASE